jgi:2-keto-4-pentenoate hydratase
MSVSSPAGDAIVRCADALYEAESSRRPIPPITRAHPELSVADAYRIQQFNIERRVRAGQHIIGHKIGLTAKAMQEQFGVNEPDYGHLLDAMVLDGASALDLGTLVDPQIEVEPAFCLGRRLKGPGVTAAEVIAATEYVSICFEVIDSRIINWQLRLQDTVADNGSSARVALGAKRISPAALDLGNLATELELDGKVVERGNTGDILGHPANGIAWLANHVGEFGVALEAGHIVLPGTCTRSRRIHGCRRLAGRIAGLGEITLEVTGAPSVMHAGRGR